jgi:hypothetical protein
MKIIVEVTRDEAHALNDLILQGYRAEENGKSGGVSRDQSHAASVWNEAYTRAMSNDQI